MKTDSVLTLTGRSAIVTGGSRNIGLAIAKKFAKSGMNVAILSVSQGSANKAAALITETGGVAIGIQCDVSDVASVEEALEAINQHFGSIDVLVNNAGVLDMAKIHEMTVEHWDEVMAINVRGAFFVIQQAVKYLEKSKAPRIINISSNSGRMGGFENGMAYSASKGAMIAMTYGVARQLASKKITVNCVAPGSIESDMLKARDEETLKKLMGRFPIGRFGTSDEVAAAVCYFASEEAGFTTGAVLDVNGGLFMG
ncbi:MAG: 3-oxoacyl-ACP reductase FabG [Bacteroidetes bacterium]|nr:3-oxoacyl-ACP reductase FabG [Bacteroidota bacterium]